MTAPTQSGMRNSRRRGRSRSAPETLRPTRASTPCCCARAPATGRRGRNRRSYFDARIDIHHVFPQGWRRENGIEAARCDSIINKTPLTAETNRSIGGQAPSEYPERIEVPQDRLDEYLRAHLIDPAHLRANDFDGFFAARQSALLRVIQKEMDKQIALDATEEGVEPPVDYELVQQDSMASVSVPE